MTSLRAGDELDGYRIDSVAARSGMASIFRATDLRTGLSVAIKVPHPEMEGDPVFFDRFHREQDIGRKLEHPVVMKVFPENGHSQLYMVLECVDGLIVRQLLQKKKKLPNFVATRISL